MKVKTSFEKTARKIASRILSIGFVASAAVIVLGCQSNDNPWQVEKYRAPGEFTPTPQSTYAPVPRILPSIEGGGFESVSQDDANINADDELEMILDELQIK